MIDVPGPCLIAVDGGGSTCRIALVWGGQRHERMLGPTNVSADFDAATAVIEDGMNALAAEAGLDPDGPQEVRVFLGLAGVMGPEIADRVRARMGGRRVRVADDRPAAVAGALGARDGTVASVGTGSFVARRAHGKIVGLGGWGWRLGDDASGYWLGRSLMAAALQAEDALRPHSAATRAVLEAYGGPSALVAATLAASAADIAALAPEVVAAAEAGDPVAVGLMAEGARYLERAIRALGWQSGETLCLLGGVGPAYRRWLPPEIAGAVTPPQGSALDGALALAAEVEP